MSSVSLEDSKRSTILTKHQRVVFGNISKPSLVVNQGVDPKDEDFITNKG